MNEIVLLRNNFLQNCNFMIADTSKYNRIVIVVLGKLHICYNISCFYFKLIYISFIYVKNVSCLKVGTDLLLCFSAELLTILLFYRCFADMLQLFERGNNMFVACLSVCNKNGCVVCFLKRKMQFLLFIVADMRNKALPLLCNFKSRELMGCFMNVLWLVLGGVFTAIEYVVSSLLLMVTIVGIPFGMQTLKLAGLALWPFGKKVVSGERSSGCLHVLMNVLWILLGGIWIAVSHLFFGAILCITVVGIPFGLQHFKLAGLALTPFGKDIVND